MNKNKELTKTIANNIVAWVAEKTVSSYIKDKLATNKSGDKIIESAIIKAQAEERPEWSRFLFDLASKGEEKTQIAIQSIPTINLTLNSK